MLGEVFDEEERAESKAWEGNELGRWREETSGWEFKHSRNAGCQVRLGKSVLARAPSRGLWYL